MSIRQTYKSLLYPIYIPSLFMGLSNQGMLILYPLYALYLTNDPRFAAIVLALRALGIILFELPAAYLANRLGNKTMMIVALCLSASTMFGLFIVSELYWIAFLAVPQGAASAIWFLCRQSYISEFTPRDYWGRAVALMAGINRAGALFGPFLGGIAATMIGYQWTFFIGGILILIAMIVLFTFAKHTALCSDQKHNSYKSVLVSLRQKKRIISLAGFIAVIIQLLRAARQLLIPIFGTLIGLNAGSIGAIYALGSLIDMSMFYPMGIIVDKFGRKWSAGPSILFFILGLLLLPNAESTIAFCLVVCLLGFANGLGTGILIIIGMDLAPKNQKNAFLGIWRLIGDFGGFACPLIVGTFANTFGLVFISTLVSGVGGLALFSLIFLLPETKNYE
jgi:MFS family permease